MDQSDTQNTHEYINTWVPEDIRERWAELGISQTDTGIIALASLREIQHAAHNARIRNAHCGNIAPGYERYASNDE